MTAEALPSVPGAAPKTFTVDAPTTELLMEHLEADTPYNITVRAVTARGIGRGISTTYRTAESRKLAFLGYCRLGFGLL